MQLKQSLPLALASIVSAQNPSLSDALGAQNSSLSTLNGTYKSLRLAFCLLQSSSLGSMLDQLSNVTILAPNNDALSSLLNDSTAASALSDSGAVNALLSYHILNGTHYAADITNMSMFIPTYLTNETYANITGGQRVEAVLADSNVTFFSGLRNNATVVTPNLNFTGGVIHIIDRVLSVPQNLTDTLSNANLTAAAGAIETADLAPAVGMMQNITVFAPDNAAFSDIGSVLANLSTDALRSTLGYHVVENAVVYSSDVMNSTLRAQNGDELNVYNINGSVFVNAARVTIPDLLISNGVVHVIDQVLNPSNSTVMPDATASSAGPAYSGASSETSGVPYTSGVATPTGTNPAQTTGGSASSTTSNPGVPMRTGAVGAAALFGGAAMLANL